MKHLSILALTICLALATSCNGQNEQKETEVLLETTAGEIRIKLYNDTPGHRDNFVKNVREGMYDGVTFHRVIRSFMIQTGDPATRNEGQQGKDNGQRTTDNGTQTTDSMGPTIPAEIKFPKYFHKRGVVAAAREGDDVNPDKASDAFQFYIVTGRFQNEEALAGFELRRKEARVQAVYAKKMQAHQAELEAMRKMRNRDGVSNLLEKLLDEARIEVDDLPEDTFEYTTEQQRAYRTYGGAPWLDGDYTIFGEVVEGMKTVLDIEKVKTDGNDKPLKEIRIVKATVL